MIIDSSVHSGAILSQLSWPGDELAYQLPFWLALIATRTYPNKLRRTTILWSSMSLSKAVHFRLCTTSEELSLGQKSVRTTGTCSAGRRRNVSRLLRSASPLCGRRVYQHLQVRFDNAVGYDPTGIEF
jgi:hypothetical protein